MKIKVIGNGGFTGSAAFEYAPGFVFTGDPVCADYDWLVVFDELPKRDVGTFHDGYEPLRCPRERTILCTWEPVTIKSYSHAYTRQFGHLLTNRPQEAERHPHYHLGRGYFPWLVGRSCSEVVARADYPKTKLISAVCSKKNMRHTAHHDRFRTLSHLERVLPEMDWYGVGFNVLRYKCDALDAYRYHVAIENYIAPDHWSEKLPDPILCECLPFYAGDPKLGEILPQESFIRIPADDPLEAERIIREAIANDEWAKRLPAIREARRLLLTKYNFWAQVIDVVKSAEGQPLTPVDPLHLRRIYARRKLRLRNPLALLSDLAGRLRINLGWR